MIDIPALLRSQPISGLAPQWIAIIKGFNDEATGERLDPDIWLFEPPAGQHVPFVDPVKTMEIMFRHQGAEPGEAANRAVIEYAKLRLRLRIYEHVRFFDLFDPEPPECIPVPALTAYLDEKKLAATVIDFLNRAVDAVTHASIFRGPDNWNTPWTLAELPNLPTAQAMIEFIPGPPWDEPLDEDDHEATSRFSIWREEMRSVADCLEKTLGEPVYYFCDPNSDHDDDNIHRFLVLHWCCTYRPESSYVKFLLKVSGAKDAEELKAALIDSKSYFHPFEMNDAFVGLEAMICHIDYLSPNARKVVGIVFSTLAAQPWAESLLLQQINVDVFIVTSKELASEEWVKASTRNCRNWAIQYLHDGQLDKPIDVLAHIDELCVIADEKSTSRGFDQKISSTIEDLLWLALRHQVPAKFFFIDGTQLGNPETCLNARSVPERVTKQDKLRESFTHQLEEIRVSCEFSSSGLWNSRGQMLGYDCLSLPFSLARRLAAWQMDFDETQFPPASGDDAWWENHEREEIEIAKELQDSLGTNIRVKVFLDGQWEWIGDIHQ